MAREAGPSVNRELIMEFRMMMLWIAPSSLIVASGPGSSLAMLVADLVDIWTEYVYALLI